MLNKQKVLLLGATGETGSSILKGLQECGNFVSYTEYLSRRQVAQLTEHIQDVEVLVRPASMQKPSVRNLQDQGIRMHCIDLNASSSELVSVLSGIDILVSAIGAQDLLQQKKLLHAAQLAGVKRVVPCAFMTVAPPQGAMLLRDEV